MTNFWANGFRSKLLPGWQDRSTITLVGPTAADGFAANIVVTRQPVAAGTSATHFGQEQVEGLAKEVGEIQVQDKRTVQLKGRELYQQMHTFRVGEHLVKQVQTYLVGELGGETIGFVITGSASPAAFNNVMPMFKRFVETFETFDPTLHGLLPGTGGY